LDTPILNVPLGKDQDVMLRDPINTVDVSPTRARGDNV